MRWRKLLRVHTGGSTEMHREVAVETNPRHAKKFNNEDDAILVPRMIKSKPTPRDGLYREVISEGSQFFQIVGVMFLDQSLSPCDSGIDFRQLRISSHDNYRRKIVFAPNLFTELKTISIWQLIRNKYKREPLKAIQFASVLDHVGPSQFITREDGCNRFSLLCITLYT